jgi:hypothetical protein
VKQLVYRATVEGQTLVVRFAGAEFEIVDPTEAMLDDPPRCAGAAGAHAWCAVVVAWRHRDDRSSRWRRDLVRDVVADARRTWADGAEQHQRHLIHVFQDAATAQAEAHYPPARPRTRTHAHAEIPPALRGAVLRPATPRRDRQQLTEQRPRPER